MTVDVETSIEIDVPREQVAAFASDPENAPRWYVNISAVVLETPPPLAAGSRMAFVAHFLGRRIAYTYEVRELVAGKRFEMSTADGPFPMQTTYTWSDTADGGTRMTLRNQGEPSGFGHVTAPVMVRAMRRANRKDLQTLKRLLEDAAT
ncbi:SRPBCC family protein [Terrabacter sp. NPDC080008]|uniref:SRPBCC family protein n=1 Tax=Terrabacter sp. NPDC080008 TaxID=3155176 RepID=UPI00344BDEBF